MHTNHGLSNEKCAKAQHYYLKKTVVPTFIQFRLEFGETEMIADLSRH